MKPIRKGKKKKGKKQRSSLKFLPTDLEFVEFQLGCPYFLLVENFFKFVRRPPLIGFNKIRKISAKVQLDRIRRIHAAYPLLLSCTSTSSFDILNQKCLWISIGHVMRIKYNVTTPSGPVARGMTPKVKTEGCRI